jgi:hypothetical protein
MERGSVIIWSLVVGTVACLLAIIIWWIANGLDPTFQDNIYYDAPLGGPPDAPLIGDTTEFAT